MPPSESYQIEDDGDYLNIVLNEEQEFEDIRSYSLTGNASSPAISSRLSRNTSSPAEPSNLSTNVSSPTVVKGLSTNTSSPAVGNLGDRGAVDNDLADNYDNEYEAQYTENYDEYEDRIGEVRLGLTDEDEWEIQAVILSGDELEPVEPSIEQLLEQLELEDSPVTANS